MSKVSKSVLSVLIIFTSSTTVFNSLVCCSPLLPAHYEIEVVTNNITGSNMEQKANDRNGSSINRRDYLEDAASPLQNSVDNLFNALKSSVRGIIQTGQYGMLRALGVVDRTVADVQTAIQNSTFSVLSEGQKAAARVFDETPQPVNRFIQRIGTVRDNRLFGQLNGVINQWRDNRKKLYDAIHEHQYDIHNVIQNAWSSANQHLGVQELPRTQLGWY